VEELAAHVAASVHRKPIPDATHGAGRFTYKTGYKTGSFMGQMLVNIPAPWSIWSIWLWVSAVIVITCFFWWFLCFIAKPKSQNTRIDHVPPKFSIIAMGRSCSLEVNGDVGVNLGLPKRLRWNRWSLLISIGFFVNWIPNIPSGYLT
jgi:hypothetical protein